MDIDQKSMFEEEGPDPKKILPSIKEAVDLYVSHGIPPGPFTTAVLEKLNYPGRMESDQVVACDDAYLGEGYTRPTDAMREAVALAAQEEGLLLDTVYTGKAMSGLIVYVRRNIFTAGQKILFVHSGGNPALAAFQDDLSEILRPPA